MGIPERKVREKEHRREEIIDAAQKIFFQKGLAITTMDEIAEAAELSKGTLYLYYKSKEDLYLAVMERRMEILHQMFSEAVASKEPTLTVIAKLGEAYYEYFKQHRHYYRMSHFFENPQFHRQVSPEMLQTCASENQKTWQIVIGAIQRGIDEGVIQKDINPKQAAVIFWVNSNGIMRQLDREDTYWKDIMGVDMEATLRQSNAMTLEAMMTDEAKKEYHEPVM